MTKSCFNPDLCWHLKESKQISFATLDKSLEGDNSAACVEHPWMNSTLLVYSLSSAHLG